MLIPSSLYGEYKNVTKWVRTSVSKIARGASFVDEMTRGGLVDTSDRDGYIAVSGRLRSSAAHFHVNLPLHYLLDLRADDKLDTSNESRVFAEAICTSWGVLCLMDGNLSPWVYAPDRRRRFINAVEAVWEELDSVGARYDGALGPAALWDIPTNVQYVLANLGVEVERLNKPLPRAGLRTLIPRDK